MLRHTVTQAQTGPLSQSISAPYDPEEDETPVNPASHGVVRGRGAIEDEGSVAKRRSIMRRFRKAFKHLRMALLSGWRELADTLKVPLTLTMLAADVVVVIPIGLFWAFWMAHNLLIGMLYMIVSQSPIIYGVLKRIKHESQYASIPKEGYEGVTPEKLPEAIKEYKELLSKQKHESEE